MPLNALTRGMICEAELRMMKPDAVLINTSRGVTRFHDLDFDADPLRGFDRVILPPHIPGHTIELYTVLPDIFVENATRIKRAETPKSKNMERKNRKVVSRVCCKIYVGLRAPHVTSCKSSDIVEACIFVR